jgi:hypothetical protein
MKLIELQGKGIGMYAAVSDADYEYLAGRRPRGEVAG